MKDSPIRTANSIFSPGGWNRIHLIVEDLVAAEAAGLAWMDVSGRVSLAAVKSQLSKVYLTMAGQPLNKGAAYYKLAADKAKEVIDNAGTIGLFALASGRGCAVRSEIIGRAGKEPQAED